jgi:hypothetical protein
MLFALACLAEPPRNWPGSSLNHQPRLASWYAGAGTKTIYHHAQACWERNTCHPDTDCKFVGDGVICGLERHAIKEVHAHLPRDAVVLEMGARFGTCSCAVSVRQRNSGLRVSLEPDIRTYESLRANLQANRCEGLAVHGVVARRPMFQYWPFARKNDTGYGNKAITARNCSQHQNMFVFGHHRGRYYCEPVATYTVQDLADQLSASVGRTVRFTALIVDCEGCLRQFMADEAEFMRDPALEYIFYESDERNTTLVEDICALGFGVVANQLDCMTPKAGGLAQVVFRRGAPGCQSQWAHCSHECRAECGLNETLHRERPAPTPAASIDVAF